MRDLVESRSSLSYVKWEETVPVADGFPKVKRSWTYNQLREARGRSDIVKGNHVSPTSYRAYDLSADSTPGSVVTGWTAKRYRIGGVYSWTQRRYVYVGSAGIPDVYIKHGLTDNFSPSLPVNIRHQAQTQALNQLVDSKVDFGQSLGELRSTVDLLTDTIRRFVAAYRNAKRGNWGGVKRGLGIPSSRKDIANEWLAYQFGWLPLLNDIFNGAEAIRTAFNLEPTLTVSSTALGDAPFPFLSGYRFEGTSQGGVVASYTYGVAAPWLNGLNSLGLINPLSLAWELLPLSFVVDWFISIGQVLSAVGADIGLVYLHGFETSFIKNNFSVNRYGYTYSDSVGYGATVSSFAMKRDPKTIPPHPGLYIRTGLNFGKALTSIALLTRRL